MTTSFRFRTLIMAMIFALVEAPFIHLQQAHADATEWNWDFRTEYMLVVDQVWQPASGLNFIMGVSSARPVDKGLIGFFEAPDFNDPEDIERFLENPDQPEATAHWYVDRFDRWDVTNTPTFQDDRLENLESVIIEIGELHNPDSGWRSWVVSTTMVHKILRQRPNEWPHYEEFQFFTTWMPVKVCSSWEGARWEAEDLVIALTNDEDGYYMIPAGDPECREGFSNQSPLNNVGTDGDDACAAYRSAVAACWWDVAGDLAICTGVYVGCIATCIAASVGCGFAGGPGAALACYNICGAACMAIAAGCYAGYMLKLMGCRAAALSTLQGSMKNWRTCFIIALPNSWQEHIRNLARLEGVPPEVQEYLITISGGSQ